MVKVKEIPQDTRAITIFLRTKEAWSYGKIAKKLDLKRATVCSIVKKHKETGSTANRLRTGRPKSLLALDEQFILERVKQDPFIRAPALAKELEAETGTKVTAQTVRNRLRKMGYRSRIACRKPFVSEANRKKRLEFALRYLNEPPEFWNRVVFTDESKFNLCGSDGPRLVWRLKNTALDPKNVVPTFKNSRAKSRQNGVVVWGCMSASGVGKLEFVEGDFNAARYVQLLEGNLETSVEKLGLDKNSYLFLQDNDPKHTAVTTRKWLSKHVPNILPLPPQSPDLNVIEHLWSHLHSRIADLRAKGRNQYRKVIEEEWYATDPQYTKKLVDSMPRRLKAIIEANGLCTKY